MGISEVRAVFLDRDGVINQLVYNPKTKEHESPHHESDFQLCPDALPSLSRLQKMGYLLFLVSNQPSYAKGKTTLENIKAIHEKFHSLLLDANIHFRDYFYCYHHEQGIVPEYAVDCCCRKPKDYFLQQAKEKYGLKMADCWLIGDRDSDIFCGQSSGVKTILITNQHSKPKQGGSQPDFSALNLPEAVKIIEGIAISHL